MIRKIIGTILIIASGVLSVVLLTNGRLIFPHVIGPSVLAIIGVFVLTIKGKMKKES